MAFNYVSIGKRIRNLRMKKGLTQMELAEMIEKSTSTISYIETGVKSMSLDTFVSIANVLGVSADELLLDSLENTTNLSAKEYTSLLRDCSEYERRVLLDALTAIKASLRNNRFYIKRRQ